jgi:hypothetical protein
MKNEGNYYKVCKKSAYVNEEYIRSLDDDFLEKIDGSVKKESIRSCGILSIPQSPSPTYQFLGEVENNIIKNELRKRKLKKLML